MARRSTGPTAGHDDPDPRPFTRTARILGGRWNLLILHELLDRPRAFQELKDRLPDVPPNVLSRNLTELQDQDLVRRRVENGDPVRVRYRLSDLGRELEPALRAMEAWGARWATP